jgi:glycosyltransferase involved in cell wall biosynthesis
MMPNTLPPSPEQCHVVFLAQYLPLHFVSTMRQLARRVGRLTLLLSEPMDASRDWRPNFQDLNVEVQRSLRFKIRHHHPLGFEDKGALLIPYSTVPDLIRLQPDVVIAVEVGARTLQAALLRALGARFKLIVQVRESESTARARGAWRRRVRRLVLPRVDEIFVNGQSGRRHVLACGADPAHVSVVPSGTDTTVFGGADHAPSGGDALRLLYVGQLVPRKGIVEFVQRLTTAAASLSRPISLTIAGRGPQEDALRAIRRPAHFTLHFAGSVPYAELPALYGNADAFVMPSLADEWGLVVNEAMASGLPVLGSTGVQAVQEMVAPEISGWSYDPEKPEEFDRSLRALLTADPSRLAAMGRAARQSALHVTDGYAAAAMFAGVRKVLQPRDPVPVAEPAAFFR